MWRGKVFLWRTIYSKSLAMVKAPLDGSMLMVVEK